MNRNFLLFILSFLKCLFFSNGHCIHFTIKNLIKVFKCARGRELLRFQNVCNWPLSLRYEAVSHHVR